MTTIRTISGIPDETWEKAQKEYTNTSKKIKELLEKDLRVKDEQETEHIDLLKNSDLTKDQLEVAREIIKSGSVEKTSSQLANVINKYYSDKDYKDKCKNSLRKSDAVPFEKDGGGLKSVETHCPECGANSPLKGLRKNGFECLKCEKRLYDVKTK